jgi:signal transduction histidine kinase/ligand-binding sensor domain-containing protein
MKCITAVRCLLLKILFLFIYIGPLSLHAQLTGFINYSIRDGLPSKTVYSVHQDHEGFIWLGTDAGVCRFDGRTFETFSVEDGLSDTEILRIYEDSKHRIWFLTLNGSLDYFYKGKFYNPENDSLCAQAKNVTTYISFLEDAEHNLWLGTFAGEVVEITHDDKVRKVDFKCRKFFEHQGRLFTTMNAKKEVCVTNGLVLINLSNLQNEDVLADINVGIFFSQIPGKIVYPQPDGIYLYENGKKKRLISYQLNENNIFRLFMDAEQKIYIVDNKYRLVEFNNENGKLTTDTMDFHSVVSQVFLDMEKNTWFVTIGSGIYMKPARHNTAFSFDKQKNLADDIVLSLLPFSDTSMIAGFSHNGVQVIEGSNHLSKSFPVDEHTECRTLGFYKDRNNRIWAATDYGIRSIDVVNGKLKVSETLINYEGKIAHGGSMKAITGSSKGDIVVAESSGLFIVPGGAGKIAYTMADSVIKRQRAFTVFYDHADNLWFSTNEGLCRFTAGKLTVPGRTIKQLSGKIMCIAETMDHTLLVGTVGHGLVMVKDDKVVKVISTSNGLESNYIRSIAIDDSLIYLGTDRGISRLKKKASFEYDITNIGISSGLISEEVNCIAVSKAYIYVGTAQGLTILKRPLTIVSDSPPEVYIKSLKVDDEDQDVSGTFSAPYDFRSIFIDFTSPVYLNAEQVTFRYRFNGSKQQWTETRIGKIDLFGLQDGKFTLEIQAKRSTSDWGMIKFVRFQVLPPFWKTWWFRMITAILIVTLSYLLIRSIVSRKYKEKLRYFREQQALEVERQRISADMHDDLGSDLTNIVIMSRVARQTVAAGAPYSNVIDDIGYAANDVISKMNEIVWALNPGNDTLENLLAYLRVHSDTFCELHNLQLHFNASVISEDKALKASLRRNIFLSVKECLHNIVKHSGADQVYIFIKVDEAKSCLDIVIKDNGRGMNGSREKSPGSGNGMINLNKRMKEISGNVDITSETEIGTTIRLNVCF